MITIISLGAGVQSTTMALMAARGEIGPMPDAAIFADTGWEPKAVYEHLAWLKSPGVLPFPVHIVSAGNIRDDLVGENNTTGQKFAAIPFFVKRVDKRGVWKASMAQRQCTKEYKIVPIHRKAKELTGVKRPKPGAVNMMIGISKDEAGRAKPSRVAYIEHTFPLLDLRISRRDCEEWLKKYEFPHPPKSACIGCHFRSDDLWRTLPREEFADACEVDAAIRTSPRFIGERYLHRGLVPLGQVDFSTAAERGQPDFFMNECEGMCGV